MVQGLPEDISLSNFYKSSLEKPFLFPYSLHILDLLCQIQKKNTWKNITTYLALNGEDKKKYKSVITLFSKPLLCTTSITTHSMFSLSNVILMSNNINNIVSHFKTRMVRYIQIIYMKIQTS